MNKLKNIFIVFVLIVSFSCSKGEQSGSQSDLINVVTTTGMINDIVVNLGGDLLESRALMGPGIDPHLYKASAGDVSVLSNADIIFYNGLHLEGKMSEIFEKMKNQGINTVAVAESVDKSRLISPEEYQGNYDPHVWFDITLWVSAVESVKQTLKKYDPKNADIYESNAKGYLLKLNELQGYVLNKVSSIPLDKRVLITAHDAFNYFGKGYKFEVIGLQGISTDTEASTSDVQKISSIIVERKIPSIFIESSVSSRYIEAVKAAVKSKGFNVKLGGLLYSDALGNPGTDEGTYIGMFRYNIDTIAAALGGN